MSTTHKDVLLQLIRECQSFHGDRVEYLSAPPTALEFSRIVSRNRPVVIRNAISNWPALVKWQDWDYLEKLMDGRTITVAETPDGNADSIVDGYFVEPHQEIVPFREMIEWLVKWRIRKDASEPVRYVQSQNGNLDNEYKVLRRDIRELDWANDCLGEEPDASNIWIGNEESITSLHLDHYENLYCQVLGSKTFHLIPPTEYPCLKEQRFLSARWVRSPKHPRRFSIKPDPTSTVPWLTIDPRALPTDSPCKPLVVTLLPGEVLYLPALWFHSVAQIPDDHGFCIAVNYWYNMDFSGPLYPLFNFLRHITMIEDGRAGEIERDDP